ncbi:MAG: hypothetical protein WAT61_11695 [Flavobacteriales bacterium]
MAFHPYFSPMSMLGFRPRFKFESPLSATDIVERIQQKVGSDNPAKLWQNNAHYHITLRFPTEHAHTWTPQLDLNLEEIPEGGSTVRCLIGPASNVWMLFAGGYLALALLGLTGLTLGFAQLSLNNTAWGFWAVPVAVVGIAVMVYLAYTGQRRAHDDMRTLKEFVDGALGCDCFKVAMEQAA